MTDIRPEFLTKNRNISESHFFWMAVLEPRQLYTAVQGVVTLSRLFLVFEFLLNFRGIKKLSIKSGMENETEQNLRLYQ